MPGRLILEHMTVARQRLGRRAEELVVRTLAARGWRILSRNFRTRAGELDVVALDGDVLVFVEVKAGRSGRTVGPERPAHAVGPRKQARVRRMAREWLGAAERPRYSGVSGYRFDVVGVRFGGDRLADVDHVRDAF